VAATPEQIRVLRLAKRHWLGLSGAVVLLAIVAAALLAPELAP